MKANIYFDFNLQTLLSSVVIVKQSKRKQSTAFLYTIKVLETYTKLFLLSGFSVE